MTRTRKAVLAIPTPDITIAPKSHGRRTAYALTKLTRENDHSEKAESSAYPSATPLASTLTKQAILIDLLKREGGASLEDMVSATGWQKHSIRGFISGTLKKKLGFAVISMVDQVAGGRIYRIVDDLPAIAFAEGGEGRAGTATDAEAV